MRYSFPKGFQWGVALSGPQTEGICNKANLNVWDKWYQEEPDRFYNHYSAEIATDTYNRYKEDVELMKKVSLNSMRTSIQWSRLIEDFETCKVSEDGYKFYRDYFQRLKDNDIEPFINLYHFDMPQELMEKYGGFESKHVSELFAKYARVCFELFGDIVKYWITMNEPIVPVEFGYWYDAHKPNKVDPKMGMQVGYNTLLAHTLAVGEFRKLNMDGEIGIILNLTPSYPRSNNEADLNASLDCDAIYNKSFMDPIVLNKFNDRFSQILKENNLEPEKSKDEEELILKTEVDFIGLNYYVPRRVKARLSLVDKNNPWFPDWHYENYEMPGSRNNPHRDNNEIYPKALYDIAKDVQQNYNNKKWYLAEIGISITNEEKLMKNGIIDDKFRTELLKEHLVELHRAIEEGSNCFGVHQWTFIDNWSWLNTHKRRYGLYYLDLETRERTLKKHGIFFKEIIERNGF